MSVELVIRRRRRCRRLVVALPHRAASVVRAALRLVNAWAWGVVTGVVVYRATELAAERRMLAAQWNASARVVAAARELRS